MNLSKSSGTDFFAWFLLIVLALIWGSSFILIKKSLVAFQPMEIASLRIISASLFLLPIAIKQLKKVKISSWKYLFASGFFGSLIPAFLFPLAQTKIDSGITGVLNALTPLFTIIIGALLFKNRFTLRVIIGIIIGLLGTVILISAGSGGIKGEFNVYALLIVFATILYGFNVNILKYILGDLKPIHIASLSMFLIGPFAAVYLLIYGNVIQTLQQNSTAIMPFIYVVVLGVFGTALALILFNKLVKVTNIVFSSSVTYLIPIVAVIWGLIDGEMLFFQHYLGMIGIITGVVIANRSKK